MSAVKGFFRIYNGFEKWTMIVMMMVMVVVIFAQVFTRYVMGAALYWSEELGKFIFVWVSWLGVSAGIHTKEHIQVKLLPDSFGKKGKWRREKINYIIVDIFWFLTSLFVLYYGSQIVFNQMGTGVYGASTGIPMWIAYMSIPFSALVVCIRLVAEIALYSIQAITGVKRDEWEEVI